MKDGFIKVAAATPKVRVADTDFNTDAILSIMKAEYKRGTKICVFPELCITAYTCSDLFFQKALLDNAKQSLQKLVKASKGHDMLTLVGLPLEHSGKLYNAAVCFQDGRLLGIVPKSYIPNYNEFYEKRHFALAPQELSYVDFFDKSVPFGTKLLFKCANVEGLTLAIEICEDVWAAQSPSIGHAMAGATVIANLSASDEVIGKSDYRRQLVNVQSGKLMCAYIYTSAGEGESTQDLVFSGHNIIAENGNILSESKRYSPEIIHTDIDIDRIVEERRRNTAYACVDNEDYENIYFVLKEADTKLDRYIDPMPFVPSSDAARDDRCSEILTIQSLGLKKRLEHINAKNVVLGLSGGLDSTLALIVCAKAYDMLGISRKGINCITMPCFGTTDRTYNNAIKLSKTLGATIKEIDIKESVSLHLKDIKHDIKKHDVTYENAQARERTQVLMDIANQLGGIVIGTGDLSELALGWATYNGDHMSMYAVNASIPKTLVRHLVRYYALTCKDKKLSDILIDVCNTPVSPELLPPTNGKISQKTEDLVGPYELHDFFLYNVLRFGYKPSKVYRLAVHAWKDKYDNATIYKWLEIFIKRFFAQQFKRSCLPDGPKVGSVTLSPRGDLRMPSDASCSIWLKDLESCKAKKR